LIGKAGLGKTHLSLALLNFIKSEGFRSELIDVQKLYKIFRDTNFYESEKEAIDKLDGLKKNHLLIIDDLGLEKQTEKWVFNYGFIELIDTFKGKLIITSNFNVEKLREIYDDKIMSRLGIPSIDTDKSSKNIETSLIIHLKGKDFRRQ